LPVTQVDKRQINDGKPGPLTRRLLSEWSETVGLNIVEQAQRFGL
jgi:branched-subunit amino acid aminotransferase/4-amino-4-deoxychorismate lyase